MESSEVEHKIEGDYVSGRPHITNWLDRIIFFFFFFFLNDSQINGRMRLMTIVHGAMSRSCGGLWTIVAMSTLAP